MYDVKNIKSKIMCSIIFMMLPLLTIYSQQLPQYSQYMYNTMLINPGFVGSTGRSELTLLGRSQWIGIEGAPQTQMLSYNTVVYSIPSLGWGLSLVNDKLGPISTIDFDASASGSVILSEGKRLALGVNLGIASTNFDHYELVAKHSYEKEVQEDFSLLYSKVGVGLYFNTESYYLGISSPNLLVSTVPEKDSKISSSETNPMSFFLIGGHVVDLSHKIKFKSSTLVSYIPGLKVSADVSGNFLFKEKYQIGVTYRVLDAFCFLVGGKVTDRFYLGYTYDNTASNLKLVNDGSHELILRFEFKQFSRRLKCPNEGLLWF